MAPVRLAVFGVGAIGARHVRLIAKAPACRLVAVADPAPAARRVADSAGVRRHADYRDLLAREAVDGVIIASPNALHAQMGLACAARGLAMLVEKPITDDIGAGRAFLDAARAAGAPVLVGHMRRFDPALAAARRIIQSGEIGRLLAVSVVWATRKPARYFDAAWRREPGGGAVMINLIHDIDALRAICGEIDSVYAEGANRQRGYAVEDTAAIVLRFRSGAVATIIMSDAAPSPWGWEQATGENPNIPRSSENCYRFLGSEAALDFPNLTLWRHAAADGCWTDPLVPAVRAVGERLSLVRQLRHFCAVARGEAQPLVTGADGLATVAAALAVSESARRRTPLAPQFTLPDSPPAPL